MTQLSAGARIKQQILERLFPDSAFTKPDAQTGTTNFTLLEKALYDKLDAYVNTVTIVEIPVLGKVNILQKIQTVDIPSPAEIRQYINKKIEQKKRQVQEQTIRAQLEEANREEMPFTARREFVNRAVNRNQRASEQ